MSILLRPYTVADEADFVRLNTDPVVRAHMDGPLTVERATALFHTFFAPGSNLVRAIVAADGGRYLGHVFMVRAEGAAAWELGYVLVAEAWGRGVATEAVRLLLGEAPAGARVEATVDLDHGASIRVLEKNGFVRSRIERDEDGEFLVMEWVG